MDGQRVGLHHGASIPVAVVRRLATAAQLSTLVPGCCGLVWRAVQAQKATGAKGGRHVAIYWNGDIRLEVGVELQGPFAETDEVFRSATPGGPAAVVTHLGPYHTLGAAHDVVRTWCEANGHRLAGPSWEIYGHWLPEWDTNPRLIRTDVFYQIA
jgi:effector-binding domain-containing protein